MQERVLLLTTRALYNLNKARKVKRRIPLERVASVTVSLVSDEFVIHVPSEYDYRIMTARKAEAVECLSAARRALTGVPLPVLDTAATTLKYAALTKSTASRRRPPASPQVQSSGGWASGPSLGDGVGASAALAGISGLTISARADASNGSIDYEDEESDVEAPPPQPRGPLVEARGVLRGSGLFAAFPPPVALAKLDDSMRGPGYDVPLPPLLTVDIAQASTAVTWAVPIANTPTFSAAVRLVQP